MRRPIVSIFALACRGVLAAPALLAGAGGVALLAGASPARATSVTPLAPEQVLAQADAIFQGRVLDSTVRWSDARRVMTVTDYTIAVERVVLDRAGVLAARTMNQTTTLTFAGGSMEGSSTLIHGVPTFTPGERAFFMIRQADLGALSPLVGVYQGLYRTQAVDGVERVAHSHDCCVGETLVRSRFFEKEPSVALGFTVDEFAAELSRAIPLAAAQPDLASPRRGVLSAELAARVEAERAARRRLQESGVEGGAVGPNGPAAATPALASPAPKPDLAERIFVDAQGVQVVSRPPVLEYGFNRNAQSPIIGYNLPPVYDGDDNNTFLEAQGQWNRFATVFGTYNTRRNELTPNNDRNDWGYLDPATFASRYGIAFGSNTLAINVSYSRSNRIVQTDIIFNNAFSFTSDYFTTVNNPSIYYKKQVALHELGHSFGRSHSFDSNPGYTFPSTMNYFQDGFFQAEAYRVFSDDAESLRVMFPGQTLFFRDFLLTCWKMSGALSSGVNGTTNATIAPTTLNRGQQITINNLWCENTGTIGAAPVVDIYITPSFYNNAGAVYCGSVTMPFLNRFQGTPFSATVTVPAGTPAGRYYVNAYIANGETYFDNSNSWSNQTIQVNIPPPPPPPSNDNYQTPFYIGVGDYSGTTALATVQDFNTGGLCGSSANSPDVWYLLTIPYDGRLSISTCGSSYDTVVSMHQVLFEPTPLPIFVVACDDDQTEIPFNCGNRDSYFEQAQLGGRRYLVRVSGFNGNRGAFQLHVRVTPFNDFCSDATAVGPGTFFGTTTGGFGNQPEACGSSASTPDIWYKFTAPCSGELQNVLHVDTQGSNYDTVLGIYSDCGTTVIDCNDDVQPGTVWSTLDIPTVSGQTYYIRVSGYSGSTGSVQLNVSVPPSSGETCADPIPVSTGSALGYNTACAVSTGLPLSAALTASVGITEPLNDLWFRYTPDCTGVASVRLCSYNHDPVVVIYPGDGCPIDPESAIAGGEPIDTDCGSPAVVSFPCEAGQLYLVRVGGRDSGGLFGGVPAGQGSIAFDCAAGAPANDSCAGAEPLAATGVALSSFASATLDGSAECDAGQAAADVWFVLDAPTCNGALTLTTCGSFNTFGVATSLAIYSDCDNPTPIACSAGNGDASSCGDAAGSPSDALLSLAISGQTRYYVRVAALNGVLSPFTLTTTYTPDGDRCESAIAVGGVPNSAVVCTFGASPDGPADDLFGAFPDLWFLLDPQCAGIVTVDTCGSPDVDSRVAIYNNPGTCPSSADLLFFNELDGPTCAGQAASISFQVAAGATYYVRVGGTDNSAITVSFTCAGSGNPVDFNGDGNVDPDDLSDFIAAFFTQPQDPRADFNLDGFIDPDDLSDFIAAYFS